VAARRGGRGRAPLLGLLEALGLGELGVADLLKVLLVRLHRRELLLLHHFHHRLLQRLAHEHLEDRLDLGVEVEEVAVVDLRLDVDARLHRDEDRRRKLVHERVGLRRERGWGVSAAAGVARGERGRRGRRRARGARLRVNVDLDGPVGELLEVLLRLHVDVLAAVDRLRRRRLAHGFYLLRRVVCSLRLPLHLELLGLRGGGQDLRRVRVAADHPLVVHDVRRVGAPAHAGWGAR